MTGIYKYGLSVIFIVLICFSNIEVVLNLTDNYKLSERRALKKRPLFKLKNWSNYIDKLEAYVNDHFGGRSFLIQKYCNLKHNKVNISPYPNEVELGKEGWYFLGNNKSDISDEHSGLKVVNNRQLKRIKDNLVKRSDQLKAMGINYYLFIAPDKHSIYPEKLPDYVSQKMITNNTDRIYDFIKDDIKTIDIRKELLHHKGQIEQNLYAKTDSHWNDYGAYFAYKKIIRVLAKDYPMIKNPLGINQFDIKSKKSNHNTTADMINITELTNDIDYEFEFKGKELIEMEPQLTVPKNRIVTSKEYEIRLKSDHAGNTLKILVIRDSFSNKLRKFLGLNFGESVWISNFHKCDMELIELEKPDIVLHQIVERSTIDLLRHF